MFNPTRQSERFDKDALYIKNIFLYSIMCPQNSTSPISTSNTISKKGIQLGEDYPKPIVDHKVAREYVMTIFKNI